MHIIIQHKTGTSKTLISAEQDVHCAFAHTVEYRITHFAHPTPDTDAHVPGLSYTIHLICYAIFYNNKNSFAF